MQHFDAFVEVVGEVGEVVEVTAGPMSQLFWKVNEVKTFTPKVVDSSCGAENVPVFKIYF